MLLKCSQKWQTEPLCGVRYLGDGENVERAFISSVKFSLMCILKKEGENKRNAVIRYDIHFQ